MKGFWATGGGCQLLPGLYGMSYGFNYIFFSVPPRIHMNYIQPQLGALHIAIGLSSVMGKQSPLLTCPDTE